VAKLSENIGRKIKAIRKTKKLTQQQFADLVGIKRSSVSNYEIGRRAPHIKELQRICEKLGVPLDYFGVKNSEINDLIARARIVFEDQDFSTEEKARVYKEIMRLYLNMENE